MLRLFARFRQVADALRRFLEALREAAGAFRR